MYKLMLVEDEPAMRENMIQSINWQEDGFELAAACANGQAAIHELNRVTPDMVVTDICMPILDGLALTEFLHHYYPSILVVILTGYHEFSYAQQALKLHVQDFILKPIVPKEFDEMLQRMRQVLEDREHQRNTMQLLRSKASQADAVLQNHFMQAIYNAPMTGAELEAAAAKSGISLKESFYCVAVCQVQETVRDIAFIQNRMDVTAYAAQWAQCPHGQMDQSYTAFLLSGESAAEAESLALRMAPMLVEDIRNICQAGARVGISRCCTRPEELHSCFREAAFMLGYGPATGQSVLYRIREGLAEDLASYAKAAQLLQDGRQKEARQCIKDLFQCIRVQNLHRKTFEASVKRLYFSILVLLPKELQKQAPPLLPDQDWFELEDLEACVNRLLEFVVQNLSTAKADAAELCVFRAKQYLERHYMESELSLNDVLEQINTSKSYFSAVFKLKTGCTFVEYLTKIRMEHSKELLRTTELRTYEIAARVGFSDSHYFSLCFKRYTGKSPSDYREAER